MKVGDFVKAISLQQEDYTHWYEHVTEVASGVLDMSERSGIIIGLSDSLGKVEVLWSDGVCEALEPSSLTIIENRDIS